MANIVFKHRVKWLSRATEYYWPVTTRCCSSKSGRAPVAVEGPILPKIFSCNTRTKARIPSTSFTLGANFRRPSNLFSIKSFQQARYCIQIRWKTTSAGIPDEDPEDDDVDFSSEYPGVDSSPYLRPSPLSLHQNEETSAATLAPPPAASQAEKEPCVINLDHQRVWLPGKAVEKWTERVVDKEDEESILFKIGRQEISGGRMRSRQKGVLHEDPVVDMRMMTHNYTVTSLASALRDREDALQQAAILAEDETDVNKEKLVEFLKIYHPRYVTERREKKHPDITKKLDVYGLEWLRKRLMRMPRAVVSAHTKRASVVLPLCTAQGVPCLLMEKRAHHLRAHPDEVCLPGGMYCEVADQTIVATSLREMREEIGGLPAHSIQVLGVFRCNWGEVHHLVGVAVTPVVCFLGELPDDLHPNPNEVSQIFTISLQSLIDSELWVNREGLAPQFLGGPHPIWGLTGYILDRFRKDILQRGSTSPPTTPPSSISSTNQSTVVSSTEAVGQK